MGQARLYLIALTYDAARTLIKALEMEPEPSREGMQKTLADPNFKAEGATGIIEFDSKTGNRKNPPKRLVHIVPCSKEQFGSTLRADRISHRRSRRFKVRVN